MTQDSPQQSPRGLNAVTIFLFFGAAIALLAATTLIFQGTFLDRAWRLNPVAHAQLALLGTPIGMVFLLLAVVLAAAAIGWSRRQRWGWGLAVIIMAIQVVGDFGNLLRGDLLRGAIGVTIAGALLFYMTRPRVRAAFGTRGAVPDRHFGPG
jgi:hypothetical protein